LNRGCTEARALIPFAATAQQVTFPAVEQAAGLTRRIDSDRKPAQGVETEWLINSRPARDLSAQQRLKADRRYWSIESPFHYRLDVIAQEDQSRVRHPTAALNRGMIGRCVLSLAAHWIARCRNKRQATLSGFYDFMSAKNSNKAFSLLTTCKSSWLPP
jgi:hypothetical protein